MMSFIKHARSETKGNKAIFLDRDGVINQDTGYIGTWEAFNFLPGAIAAMQKFGNMGFRLFIITNQSGISRGYFSRESYDTLTNHMLTHFEKYKVNIEAVYTCPHLNESCNCRKPKPGMINAALFEHKLNPELCIMVGDKKSDIIASKEAKLGASIYLANEQTDNISDTVSGACVFSSLQAFSNSNFLKMLVTDPLNASFDVK